MKTSVHLVALVMSLMGSLVLSFFPRDVLDEIWDFIEAVSEVFLPALTLAAIVLK